MKNNKDKGSGFASLSEKNAIQKIEEQLGKAKLVENDPILKFTNKIQKILRRLRKEKSLQIENISKYIRQILYYHDCKVQ